MSQDQADKAASFVDEGTADDIRKSIEAETQEQVEEPVAESSVETASESVEEGTVSEEQWFEPGRFRTKDDFRRSYTELEQELTRRASEMQKLKAELSGRTKEVPSPNDEVQDFARKVEKNPVYAIDERAERVAERKVQQAMRAVRFEQEYNRLMTNEEFKQLTPTMQQIAAKYQDRIEGTPLADDPEILHLLFYAARGVQQHQSAQQAEQKGKAKGEAVALKKVRAGVEGTSGSKGHTTKKAEDMSLEELRKAIESGAKD